MANDENRKSVRQTVVLAGRGGVREDTAYAHSYTHTQKCSHFPGWGGMEVEDGQPGQQMSCEMTSRLVQTRWWIQPGEQGMLGREFE